MVLFVQWRQIVLCARILNCMMGSLLFLQQFVLPSANGGAILFIDENEQPETLNEGAIIVTFSGGTLTQNDFNPPTLNEFGIIKGSFISASPLTLDFTYFYLTEQFNPLEYSDYIIVKTTAFPSAPTGSPNEIIEVHFNSGSPIDGEIVGTDPFKGKDLTNTYPEVYPYNEFVTGDLTIRVNSAVAPTPPPRGGDVPEPSACVILAAGFGYLVAGLIRRRKWPPSTESLTRLRGSTKSMRGFC